jgi:hypothetical protein
MDILKFNRSYHGYFLSINTPLDHHSSPPIRGRGVTFLPLIV